MLAGKTILVVEDERIVAKDLQRSLIALGYDVPATAASAEDALRAACERCPDLALMDIRIKGELDGIETASILRRRFGVPVIYLTAYADEVTVSRAKLTEPQAYLLKPVKIDELRSAVEIALYRHDADRRLRERERWLATTLRAMGDAVISTDARGHIRFMNPVAETLTGYGTHEVCDRPLREVLRLVDPAHKALAHDPIERVLHTGQISGVEALLTVRGGQERVIADSAAPIRDEDGELVGVVVVLRDVSEARQVARKLAFAERLASLGTLVAGVAHEINNPLSSIVANLECGLTALAQRAEEVERTPWLSELRQALADAQLGAERVSRVVSDLSLFARPANEVQTKTDVNLVLQSCLDTLVHELSKQIAIETQLRDVPLVMANPTRLTQVFTNLLLNAAQACAGRGREGRVRLSSHVDEAGRVAVEIADNGPGMSLDVQRRIFDPFFTTKDVGQGMGLGLSVCHGIVNGLGGELSVVSSEGRGAAFRVVLPATEPQPSAALAAPALPAADGRMRVLVVEDDATVRRTIARALGSEPVLTLTDGAPQALALIESGKRYDVILCDVMMPRVTGIELYQVLLERCADQADRMVFVSGGAFSPDDVAFLRAMEDRRIAKPFEPAVLRGAVDACFARWGPAR